MRSIPSNCRERRSALLSELPHTHASRCLGDLLVLGITLPLAVLEADGRSTARNARLLVIGISFVWLLCGLVKVRLFQSHLVTITPPLLTKR